jgi:hypothetical protein
MSTLETMARELEALKARVARLEAIVLPHTPTPLDTAEDESANMRVPFGRQRGERVRDLDADNLAWAIEFIGASLDDPEKRRWRDDNRRLLDALVAERDRREARG